MAKPTVHDIAREAGVSLATVDRVLNARPGVRPQTVDKVRQAIRRIGYVRDVTAANLARQRQYRFLFLLPDGQTQFLDALRDAVRSAAAAPADRTAVHILDAPIHDGGAMTRLLAGIDLRGLDGLAILANETPAVRDTIARLKAAGLAVVTLITDQPDSERDDFVGIDNLSAGRTAATLLGRFVGPRPGRVVVLANTMLARDMVERRKGFDQVMAARFGHLRPMPSLEGRDDRLLTARILRTCLGQRTDIVGLYCMGAGMRGVTRAVAEAGLEGRLVVVGHELTPHSRAALLNGAVDAVITQNTGHIARSALRILRARCDGAAIVRAQERIRIDILLRENLPDDGFEDPAETDLPTLKETQT
jgi:LacI family transcriptional regulator